MLIGSEGGEQIKCNIDELREINMKPDGALAEDLRIEKKDGKLIKIWLPAKFRWDRF